MKKTRTLPSLIHEFCDWKAVTAADNTIRVYRETLELYAHFCYDRQLAPLEPASANKWVGNLRAPLKGVRVKGITINTYVARLRSFFEWGIQMDYFIKNPAKLIPKLPPEAAHVRGFTEDEVKQLVVSSGADESRAYWYPMILLGWHYGMRLQDCAEFSSTIDWKRSKFIFMPQKQSRREIELPLHDDLAKALLPLDVSNDHYFSLAAERYHSNTLSSEFKAIVRGAGIPDQMTFHCLRHGAATNMIKMGIALTSIVEIIGWSSTAMLQRYLDTDEKELSKLKTGGSVISPPPSARMTASTLSETDGLSLLTA
jgi:site-specific recombinase XerD